MAASAKANLLTKSRHEQQAIDRSQSDSNKQWHAPPPIILHEYQKKGVTEIAFRKLLILKGAILVVGEVAKNKIASLKTKAGASSRSLSMVLYRVNYATK
jgi:hypothetical protein